LNSKRPFELTDRPAPILFVYQQPTQTIMPGKTRTPLPHRFAQKDVQVVVQQPATTRWLRLVVLLVVIRA
jgi:hypothetical protein